MNLGEYIKNYRKEHNLTQTEFAEKLFVTKQTISKWETGKGLPDISLYKTLSSILNVSVDELLCNEKENPIILKNDLVKKKNKKPKKILIISLVVATFNIALIIFIIALISISPNAIRKNNHIKETESFLDVDLPRIIDYEYVDLYEWIEFSNTQYPQDLYYFVFDKKIEFVDETFEKELPNDVTMYFPSLAKEYLKTCDYFKLVNKDTLEINQAPNPFDNKYDRFVLYCVQEESKRLIVINFEL